MGVVPGESEQSVAEPVTVELTNGGNNVDSIAPQGSELVTTGVFTLAAGAQPITESTCTITDKNGVTTKWTYSGTIAPNTSLVIDTGKESIVNNGANAWADFTVERDRPRWLTLEPHKNEIYITLTGGAGTLTVEYNDQWT